MKSKRRREKVKVCSSTFVFAKCASEWWCVSFVPIPSLPQKVKARTCRLPTATGHRKISEGVIYHKTNKEYAHHSLFLDTAESKCIPLRPQRHTPRIQNHCRIHGMLGRRVLERLNFIQIQPRSSLLYTNLLIEAGKLSPPSPRPHLLPRLPPP